MQHFNAYSIYGDLGTRIKAYGYSYSSCAENVDVGYNNEAMAVEGTPSKHAQSRYAHFAAGLSRGFWVQVFGMNFKYSNHL
ncbi:hypothetical protein F8M41_009665 [Gigaspora margarita]|uniref:Uncharacterized protein n=1 Tax=Gigaspora margarita TaxID=4874 RepID=A0A8H3X1S6_GIGMA|nr:hypothetical protein F8M41_009665 [Gigaspora margarita]